MQYLFGTIALIVLAMVATQWFITANAGRLARNLRLIVAGTLLVATAFLVLRGQLHLAAMLLTMALMMATGGIKGRVTKKREGQRSTVRTAMLEMHLEHDSGAMSGMILAGTHAGRALTDLSRADLLTLLSECRASDPQSAGLLEAYLDAMHAGWRESDATASAHDERSRASPEGSMRMSAAEARQILGVGPNASAQEIQTAWREQMRRNHPDRGGSSYLAAKINEAKDVLLGGD